MRQSHLILSNAGIIWVAQVLQLVPQVIFVPYLISTIGEIGYGIYALVWALIMSIDQLEKSLQSGVVKYSAGFLAQDRIEAVNKIISTSFLCSLFLAALACAGLLAAALFYKDPTGKIDAALIMVGIMLLFIIPLTPYVAVIQSRQRYYVGAIADALSKYASLIVVVIWFRLAGPSVEALIIVMAVMLFFSRLAQVPIAYRFIPGLQNNPRLFSKESFRMIAAYGAATVLVSACLAVNTAGIRWLMDSLVSTRFVAHLAIMLMPGLLLSQIIGAMSITAMPATSTYEATGNLKMLQALLVRGMRYTMILALAGLLASSLLMRNVLSFWVGSEYEFLAPYALSLFACWAFMLSTSIAHHMLKGLSKLRVVVFIYFVGFVIIPVVTILVIFQVSRNPYIATTIGLAAGHLVCGFLNIVFCAKYVHVSLRVLFMSVYALPVIFATAVWLIAFGVTTLIGFYRLFEMCIVAVLAILLFFGSCYFFIATTVERQQLIVFLKVVLERVSGHKMA